MTAEIHQMVRERFSKAHNILIVSHVRPDGDAVGALLGLGLALSKSGKQVQMVLNDGIPALFRHLPGADLVKNSPEANFDKSKYLLAQISAVVATLYRIRNNLDPIKADHNLSYAANFWYMLNGVVPDKITEK